MCLRRPQWSLSELDEGDRGDEKDHVAGSAGAAQSVRSVEVEGKAERHGGHEPDAVAAGRAFDE